MGLGSLGFRGLWGLKKFQAVEGSKLGAWGAAVGGVR